MNVEQKHAIGADEIEADAAGREREQHDAHVHARVRVEAIDDLVALVEHDVAADRAVLDAALVEAGGHQTEHARPLRHDDDLVLGVLVEQLLAHLDHLGQLTAHVAALEQLAHVRVAVVQQQLVLDGLDQRRHVRRRLIAAVASTSTRRRRHLAHVVERQRLEHAVDIVGRGLRAGGERSSRLGAHRLQLVLVEALAEQTHVAAGLAQAQQVDEHHAHGAVAVAGRGSTEQALTLLVEELVDLGLRLLEDLVVDEALARVQTERAREHLLLGQVDDALGGALDGVGLGATQQQVVRQEEEPRLHARLALGRVRLRHLRHGAGACTAARCCCLLLLELLRGEDVAPQGLVVERLEVQELDERVEVVERVVHRCARDGDAVLGAQRAHCLAHLEEMQTHITSIRIILVFFRIIKRKCNSGHFYFGHFQLKLLGILLAKQN